ncbi:hypothetical protein GCM10018952_71780 [Streptosporangium vulgare]
MRGRIASHPYPGTWQTYPVPQLPVIAVVGPTAAGKSDLAVDLALELGGEVINTDSMQLYRGMDIGTAKLSVAERRGVPHHLLDIWDVTKAASVAEYQSLARPIIDGLRAREIVPILVGGSGLYVRAALDDLEFPGTDPEVRARLEAELDLNGPGPLYERLRERDPKAAETILPGNGRRIVRALEVIEISGRPVLGHDAVVRRRLRQRPAGGGGAQGGAGRTGRGPGRAHVAGRSGGRGQGTGRAWARRRPYGQPRPRVRPGAELPRR